MFISQSETFTPPSGEVLDAFPDTISTDLSPHGTDGPVQSSFSNYQYPVIRESGLAAEYSRSRVS